MRPEASQAVSWHIADVPLVHHAECSLNFAILCAIKPYVKKLHGI